MEYSKYHDFGLWALLDWEVKKEEKKNYNGVWVFVFFNCEWD